ncbi:MAG: S1-like domain-containing RNA-binding protein [Bacteroidota bacterium]
MIQLGQYQTLTIDRLTSVGFFLKEEESEQEVLLPQKYIEEGMEEGGEVEVFVYADSEDRMVATTERPLLIAGEFGYLKVREVNQFGAFMDWGLVEKNLLVPFKNQARRMEEGRWYVVYLYEDTQTNRLVGSSKVDHFLSSDSPPDLQRGDKVDLLIRGNSEIGVNVIINHAYHGLIYRNEVFESLHPGERRPGYVKLVREDHKIDISLQPIGFASIEPGAQKILEMLQQESGFLPFTDKSDPQDIREQFGMSKKLFKKAIGSLYKQQLISLMPRGISLNSEKKE